MLDERLLATVKDYNGIMAVIAARIAEINITNATLEDITGLPDRYVAKVLSKSKAFGPLSFDLIVQGLGIKFVAFEDAKQTEKMRPRWRKREKAPPIAKPLSSRKVIPDFNSFMRRLGRRGGKARIHTMTPAKRRRIARLGGRARWKIRRKARVVHVAPSARQARTA